jgi:hypothetical protein
MHAITPILRGAACSVLLAASLAGTAGACEQRPQPPVMVTVGPDGTPVVDRDPIRACEGDTIRWVFRGNAREFAVIFTDAANSPFTWDRQTGATVLGTVRSGAAQVGTFKYDVEVAGRRLDPQIIIER